MRHCTTDGYRVGTGRGVLGWVYRVRGGVYYPAVLHWYCQGPTDASLGTTASPMGTPGPSWALRTPMGSRTPYQANRARFSLIYPKVSLKSGVSTK